MQIRITKPKHDYFFFINALESQRNVAWVYGDALRAKAFVKTECKYIFWNLIEILKLNVRFDNFWPILCWHFQIDKFSAFQKKKKNIEYGYVNTLRIRHQLNIQTGSLKKVRKITRIKTFNRPGSMVFFPTNVCVLCVCGMQSEKKN